MSVISHKDASTHLQGEVYRIHNKYWHPCPYQDVAIASTFIDEKGDWLLTRNLKHFTRILGIWKAVINPTEFKRIFDYSNLNSTPYPRLS